MHILLLTTASFCVVLFLCFCVLCLLVVLVRLSVPVPVIDLEDSSPKWPICVDGDVKPYSLTHSLTHYVTGFPGRSVLQRRCLCTQANLAWSLLIGSVHWVAVKDVNTVYVFFWSHSSGWCLIKDCRDTNRNRHHPKIISMEMIIDFQKTTFYWKCMCIFVSETKLSFVSMETAKIHSIVSFSIVASN